MPYETLECLIDGEWLTGASGQAVEVLNPATEDVLGELAMASETEIDWAGAAAQKGFRTWRAMTALQRQVIIEGAARLMEERRGQIAESLTREMGKTLPEALGELDFSISTLRWYGEEGKRTYGRVVPSRVPGMRMMVVREPVGPVAAMVAWNYPALNVIRKIAGALAAGCSIVIKPSAETPGTCVALARCFQDAGLPDGVLGVVFGPAGAISGQLIGSPIYRKISFTGSVPVGKDLQHMAADTLKRCTMELGGHAPCIVFDDVDVEATAKTLVAAKFRNAGQICASPTRFYVQENVAERFAKTFAEAAKQIRVGDGMSSETMMGPLVSERRVSAMQAFVDDAAGRGVAVLAGGERLGNKGYFYPPTVLYDVQEEAMIMNEEPFGPVVPISLFKDLDEVIDRANRLPFGLASYAFTQDAFKAGALSDKIEAGMIAINSPTVSTPELPFGGIKESGYGHEGGTEGIEAYLQTKVITETYPG